MMKMIKLPTIPTRMSFSASRESRWLTTTTTAAFYPSTLSHTSSFQRLTTATSSSSSLLSRGNSSSSRCFCNVYYNVDWTRLKSQRYFSSSNSFSTLQDDGTNHDDNVIINNNNNNNMNDDREDEETILHHSQHDEEVDDDFIILEEVFSDTAASGDVGDNDKGHDEGLDDDDDDDADRRPKQQLQQQQLQQQQHKSKHKRRKPYKQRGSTRRIQPPVMLKPTIDVAELEAFFDDIAPHVIVTTRAGGSRKQSGRGGGGASSGSQSSNATSTIDATTTKATMTTTTTTTNTTESPTTLDSSAALANGGPTIPPLQSPPTTNTSSSKSIDDWIRLLERNVDEKHTLVGKLTVYDKQGKRFPMWLRTRLLQVFQGGGGSDNVQHLLQHSVHQLQQQQQNTDHDNEYDLGTTAAKTDDESSVSLQTKLPPPPSLAKQQQQQQQQQKRQERIEQQLRQGYAPIVNREHFDDHVNILMQARDMAFRHARLQWSAAAAVAAAAAAATNNNKPTVPSSSLDSTDNDYNNDEDASLTVREWQELQLMRQRQQRHDSKSPKALRREAEDLANHLADNLPIEYHKSVIRMLRVFAQQQPQVDGGDGGDKDAEGSSEGKPKGQGDTTWILNHADDDDDSVVSQEDSSLTVATTEKQPLLSAAEKRAARRKRRIARKRQNNWKKLKMKFLCHGLQPIVKSHLHLVALPMAEFFDLDLHQVESDPHVVAARSKWNKSRERFVSSLLAIHQKLVLQGKIKIVDGDAGKEGDEQGKDDDDDDGDNKNDNKSDKDLENSMDVTMRSRSVKSLKALFREENWNHRRHPLAFEALVLQDLKNNSNADGYGGDDKYDNDDDNGTMERLHVDTSQVNQMVFVDNLPVDIQELELMDMFAHCGNISNVKIFNQRLDLDPGPLTKKKQAAMHRKRKALAPPRSSRFHRWERPRSPVYGLITFADQNACDEALDDSLRIFGMVVRRHAVRTMQATEVTKIYIEGIPTEFESVLDIEYLLGQCLKPDIFISIQLGQKVQRKLWSCEINFPNFESAYISYHKLERLPMLRDRKCRLNWFRTPWNAPQYWTRQIGYDFS